MLANFRVPQMSLGGRTQSSFSNLSLIRGICPDRKSAFFVHFLLPASDPDKATSSNQAYRYHNDVHQRRHCTRRPHCQRAVTSHHPRCTHMDSQGHANQLSASTGGGAHGPGSAVARTGDRSPVTPGHPLAPEVGHIPPRCLSLPPVPFGTC